MENKHTKTEYEQIKDIITAYIKYWSVFLLSFIACSLLGALYYITADRVYNITSIVSIRHDASLTGNTISSGSSMLSAIGLGNGSTENIEDETLKLGSVGYVRNVISQYGLNAYYEEVKFGGFSKKALYDQPPILITAASSIPDTITKTLKFTIKASPERIKVKVKSGFKTLANTEIQSLPGTINTPYGDFTLTKSAYYENYEFPMHLAVTYGSYDRWAQLYRKDISVKFEKKTSDLIYLSMESENTYFAQRFLLAMIDSYNKEWDFNKKVVSSETITHIDKRLAETTQRLNAIDNDVLVFKSRNNMTDIEADVAYYFAQSAEIQSSLLEARIQLDLIDAVYSFTQSSENKNTLIPYSTSIADQFLSDIIATYNDAVIKNRSLSGKKETPLSKSVEEEIEMYRKNILTSIENVRKDFQVTVDNILRKEQSITNKLANIPQVEKDYIELKREQELQQGILIFLLEMREQAEVSGISILPKLNIIDRPYIINDPVSPSILKIAFLIFLFGVILIPISIIHLFPNIRKGKADD